MKKVYRIYRINGYSTKEMGFTASKKKAVNKILAACEDNGGVLYLKQGDLYEYYCEPALLMLIIIVYGRGEANVIISGGSPDFENVIWDFGFRF